MFVYKLTYPWIFHYVTADISLNIHGYFSFYAMGMSFWADVLQLYGVKAKDFFMSKMQKFAEAH